MAVSKQYLNVCITHTDLQVRIPANTFFGDVEVERYGVWGSVCDTSWNDADAKVVCNQLDSLREMLHVARQGEMYLHW